MLHVFVPNASYLEHFPRYCERFLGIFVNKYPLANENMTEMELEY